MLQLVVFVVEGRRYALHLDATLRVLPMVAVSPLPQPPAVVLGAINLHGTIVPVLDIRRRLDIPPGDYGPAVHLLVAQTDQRVVALPVDEVLGICELATSATTRSDDLLPGVAYVSGIVALPDGLLLIQDLDAFLSLEEEADLSRALEQAAP